LTLDWEEPPVPPAEIAELFQTVEKAARAHRMYAANNPVYQSFHTNVRGLFAKLWDRVSSLQVTVEEHAFKCFDKAYRVGEGRDELPMLFYKDGIRVITFLPGFEDEAERFLQVVNKAKLLDHKAIDDIVTLLWEQEFSSFQYSYVDMLAEGLVIPPGHGGAALTIDPALLRADAERSADTVSPSAVETGAASVASLVSAANFVETTYFLEPQELETLEREVTQEWKRDTKKAVLDALFDRVEDADSDADRKLGILRILRQLMPVYLGGGDLASASRILVDLNALIQGGVLAEREATEVRDLFHELSEPKVLAQLLASLSDGSINPAESDLSVFLSHLGPRALALLIHAAETTEVTGLKDKLRAAIEALAQAHTDVLLGLIDAQEQTVVLGATRLAGQLGLGTAVAKIGSLLTRPEAEVRRVAVDALVKIRSGQALAAVQNAITDADREVRITAVRGIASVRYQPARALLEEAIQSRQVDEADLTEQIAFFEAYGALATPDSVKLLDKMLNGKRLFSKERPEIRACAAMALGKVQAPAAKAALQQALTDASPIVRNAVARALGGEVPAR
jgi:HEAT repeat protein